MEAFEIGQLEQQRRESGRLYLEFLKVPAISAGLYTLRAGQDDPQQPHTEDEIYYVVSGKASFVGGDKEYKVQAGTVLFVEANLEHHFLNIEENLSVLVIFAPAEYSLKKD
jgi:mannose-6-phosphate isomerase-like protein (cupin superfamily)